MIVAIVEKKCEKEYYPVEKTELQDFFSRKLAEVYVFRPNKEIDELIRICITQLNDKAEDAIIKQMLVELKLDNVIRQAKIRSKFKEIIKILKSGLYEI